MINTTTVKIFGYPTTNISGNNVINDIKTVNSKFLGHKPASTGMGSWWLNYFEAYNVPDFATMVNKDYDAVGVVVWGNTIW